MNHFTVNKMFFLKVCTLLTAGCLGFAFIAQYVLGIIPCNLCLYERYVYAALLCISCLFIIRPYKIYFSIALGIIAAGIILGGFHLGVEWHLWQAPESCGALSTSHNSFEDFQAAFMKKPVTRCDIVGWVILGISATVWNFLFWLGLGVYGAVCYISNKNKLP